MVRANGKKEDLYGVDALTDFPMDSHQKKSDIDEEPGADGESDSSHRLSNAILREEIGIRHAKNSKVSEPV